MPESAIAVHAKQTSNVFSFVIVVDGERLISLLAFTDRTHATLLLEYPVELICRYPVLFLERSLA